MNRRNQPSSQPALFCVGVPRAAWPCRIPSSFGPALLFALAAAFLVFAALLPGCTSYSTPSAPPTSAPTSAPSIPTTSAVTTPSPPLAVIATDGGGTVTVALELAITPEQQARGLMFREHLEPNAGMLFIFGHDAQHAFWMRNTLIPLDVLYISSNDTVVHIRHQAQPLDETVYYPPVPCRYVLEVNGGFCVQEGVAEGSRVTFSGT